MSDRLARIRAARFCGPFGALPIPPFRVTYSHQDFDVAQSLADNLSAIRGDSKYGYSLEAFAIARAAVRSASY